MTSVAETLSALFTFVLQLQFSRTDIRPNQSPIMFQQVTLQDSDILKLSNLLNAETNQNASVSNFMVMVQYQTKQGSHCRTDCFHRIRSLHYFYSSSPATFAVAVTIMDCFLLKGKVEERYLSCLSAACYLIASKFIEEDLEVSVSSLVSLHLNQWTAEDLRQLERCILVLFSWHIPSCTYLIFLQALLDIIHSKAKTPLPPLDYFIQKAEVCLQAVSSFVLRPSSLALGVLEYCLRREGLQDRMLMAYILTIQNVLQICDSELYECESILSQTSLLTTRSLAWKPCLPQKVRNRPSWEGSTDLQTIDELDLESRITSTEDCVSIFGGSEDAEHSEHEMYDTSEDFESSQADSEESLSQLSDSIM